MLKKILEFFVKFCIYINFGWVPTHYDNKLYLKPLQSFNFKSQETYYMILEQKRTFAKKPRICLQETNVNLLLMKMIFREDLAKS